MTVAAPALPKRAFVEQVMGLPVSVLLRGRGAEPWMLAARDAARAVGVPDHHIHLERFSW